MNSMYVSKLNNTNEQYKHNAEEMYRNPMPLDMINKFVGLDSRILSQDNVVQKQAFDQSYKNFWSFVNFNLIFGEDNPTDNNKCTHQGFTQSVKPESSVTKGNTCSGVKMSYQEARLKANQI